MNKKAQNQVSKGVVSVEEYQGRLRLRWSYAGKRYCLSLSLPNTKVNHKAAQQKALQIELDIASGNFDPTLGKYKPATQKADEPVKDIGVVELFQQFRDYKAKTLYPRSREKYDTTLKNLSDCFNNKLTSSLKVNDVEKFTLNLSSKLSPITLKERLTIIRACWDWGIKH